METKKSKINLSLLLNRCKLFIISYSDNQDLLSDVINVNGHFKSIVTDTFCNKVESSIQLSDQLINLYFHERNGYIGYAVVKSAHDVKQNISLSIEKKEYIIYSSKVFGAPLAMIDGINDHDVFNEDGMKHS